MENILSQTSNIELNRINDCMPISKKSVHVTGLRKMNESRTFAPLETRSSIDSFAKDYESELAKDSLLHPIDRKYENTKESGEAFKNDKNCNVTNEISGCLNYSMDTDDLDMDIFFTADCDFTTFEEQNRLDRSLTKSISQTSKIQRCDSPVQNTKHLESTKKESTMNLQKQTKEQQHLPRTLQERITDVKARDTRYSRENRSSSYNDTTRSDNSNLNVKSTLPVIKRNAENSKTLVSYFINDRYDEYDSDDEILSQLDVGNIFNEPKKGC